MQVAAVNMNAIQFAANWNVSFMNMCVTAGLI